MEAERPGGLIPRGQDECKQMRKHFQDFSIFLSLILTSESTGRVPKFNMPGLMCNQNGSDKLEVKLSKKKTKATKVWKAL